MNLEKRISKMLGGMSTEELKKKIKKEFPEILQNMFDDSVILNVKIEDDTEKHKNHDKYKVTVLGYILFCFFRNTDLII